MWSTRRISCIFQDCYPLKVQFFWRAFGLQTIGGPIIYVKASLSIIMDVVDTKDLVIFLIVGQKT
jgi:hypothetical protein